MAELSTFFGTVTPDAIGAGTIRLIGALITFYLLYRLYQWAEYGDD